MRRALRRSMTSSTCRLTSRSTVIWGTHLSTSTPQQMQRVASHCSTGSRNGPAKAKRSAAQAMQSCRATEQISSASRSPHLLPRTRLRNSSLSSSTMRASAFPSRRYSSSCQLPVQSHRAVQAGLLQSLPVGTLVAVGTTGGTTGAAGTSRARRGTGTATRTRPPRVACVGRVAAGTTGTRTRTGSTGRVAAGAPPGSATARGQGLRPARPRTTGLLRSRTTMGHWQGSQLEGRPARSSLARTTAPRAIHGPSTRYCMRPPLPPPTWVPLVQEGKNSRAMGTAGAKGDHLLPNNQRLCISTQGYVTHAPPARRASQSGPPASTTSPATPIAVIRSQSWTRSRCKVVAKIRLSR
mmetsp:Transcript_54711/g.123131  ORF Transcript_54711/g.123131 Transcript_54711/m.123131 type:complete len:353 (+) Transcript_54711:252-1310(+)